MRFIWIRARKDLQRLRREPLTLITWVAIPIFVVVILTLVFGPGRAKPHGTLLLVDEDGGPAAAVFEGVLSQRNIASLFSVEKVSRQQGRARLEKGEASALLIVPSGFTAGFLGSQPVALELIKNPSQRILPAIIEETLDTMIENAPRVRDQIGPPLIGMDATVIPNRDEQPGGFATMLLPGALFMAVFFMAGALAADVWRERSSGALRRIATTPANLGAFLAGKLAAAALVFVAVGACGLLAAQALMHLRIANFPLAILWITMSGCGLYLLILPLQSLASSERVATLLTSFLTLPLVMLGGGFVPFEWMPAGIARAGQWTPNGWSVIELRAVLTGSAEPAIFAWVAVFLAAAWFVNIRVVRRAAC